MEPTHPLESFSLLLELPVNGEKLESGNTRIKEMADLFLAKSMFGKVLKKLVKS